MKKTTLPRRRYGTEDYPLVDEEAIGRIIPIGYGEFEHLLPTQIDTAAHEWKIVDQAIAEITRIASATKDPLIEGLDYTEDLAKAEFTLLFNEKISWIPTYYWFSIEADYAVSGSNYFGLDRNEAIFTAGIFYEIDQNEGWTSPGDGRDILFQVLGKTSYESSEITLAQNLTGKDPAIEIGLKDSVDRTQVGQSFHSAYTAYVTKIIVYGVIHGNLSGKKLRCTVWSDVGMTQVGNPTEWAEVAETTQMPLVESNENEELECDIKTPSPLMTQAADILPDVIENIMGKNPAILDATHLANLATDRTQPLEIFLREEIEFGDFVAKLEAGQLWKLIPKQDATYMTVVFEDGEPGNTPHFRDHDFLSFEMEHSVVDMRHIVNAFYAEDPTIGDYSAVQKTSDVARFFYMNEQSMDVETYLRDLADAEALASAYLARYEVPVITATFEVHSWALDLLPGRDKVKLTRARAPYGGNAWPWKRRVKLPPPGENLTDFPVQAPIVADAHIGSWARPDGHDIRFTDLDGNELPYERESWAVTDGEATAIFWVKTDVSTAGTYIWCYYGNAAATDGENAEAVWDANFKAVYHMKDATTSTILDSTGNDNDGAKAGANQPIEAAGKIGKGQDFDGTDDLINIDHAGFMHASTPYTAEAWFKLEGAGAAQVIIGKDEPATSDQQYMIYWDAGYFRFRHATAYHSTVTVYYAPFDIGTIDGNWHHVCGVWDDVAGKIYIYADGVSVISGDALTGYAYTDANGHAIGCYPNWGFPFDGLLDEARVSSIARSADWIAYEYANMNPADGGLTWGNPERTGGSLDGVLFRIVKLIKKPESNIVEVTACVWGNSPT